MSGEEIPKKWYEKKYEDKEYAKLILIAASNGKSPDIFAGNEYISPRLIDEWRDDHIEFDDAYKIALLVYRNYWESKLIQASTDEDGKNMMYTAKEMLSRLSMLDKGEVIYSPNKKPKKKTVDKDDMDTFLNNML